MINPFVLISNKIACALDNKRDKKISGRNLGVFVPTPFARSHGATGSQSAPYLGLAKVMQDFDPKPEDSFIDIGCGKGRVIIRSSYSLIFSKCSSHIRSGFTITWITRAVIT